MYLVEYFTTDSSIGMAVLAEWKERRGRTWITWHCPVPLALMDAAGVIQGVSLMTFTVHLCK